MQSGRDVVSGVVVIVSYDLAMRLQDALEEAKFKVIICDEAHYLKNDTAKRTQVIVPLLRQAKRALLLTGLLIQEMNSTYGLSLCGEFVQHPSWLSPPKEHQRCLARLSCTRYCALCCQTVRQRFSLASGTATRA